MKKIFFFSATMLLWYNSYAQDNNYGVKGFFPQTMAVTDSSPVNYNGIKAGYEIKSIDLDSKKDNQGKYKITFYVTNTSTEAKIMYQSTTFMGHSGPISNNFALFKCLNATGARFTNKMCTMELQPCRMNAKVEDKDCNGKTTVNSRQVEIGYWIKPGETVSKTYPMYVPQNEKPNITVTFNPEVANQTGIMMNGGNNTVQLNNSNAFVHIKNFAFNTYLNNQSGNLQCTTIENGWWSAEWQMIPVQGTENFYIVNHWKNTYLSGNGSWLTDNMNAPESMWTVQESSTPNVYYIKNISNSARLFVDGGMLKLSSSFISNDNSSKWLIQ
ncbi:MAG: hypothetical protein JST86_07075 [Bacteroidetes bacterium]|nr:hypothetical protein [Bacteroidota bacterium]